jgi:hypothetical protein
LYHAQAEADNEQNQGDFKRHGYDADERPHWTMDEVADDHAIHHDFGRAVFLKEQSF